MSKFPVVILHAYDARNRGDGLLVEETLRILQKTGVADTECCVVAATAGSFPDSLATLQYPAFGTRGIRRFRSSVTVGQLALSGVSTGRLGSMTEIGKLVRHAELIVGVGGGYLRAPRGKACRDVRLFHLPQLALAAASDAPSIYMPQSIGPLHGSLGSAVRRHLKRIDHVMARDDITLHDIEGPGVERYPDLAVMKIAREFMGTTRPGRGKDVVLAARALAIDDYPARLHRLASLLPVDWAVHSRALGQDDEKFYRSIGIVESQDSEDLFARNEVGVVISVRLHGALQAIIAGIPAIHLGYERKGASAYSDLGLEKWVHDVHNFSPEVVAKQAAELRESPSEFWSCIGNRIGGLETCETRLVERIRRLRNGSRN